MSAPPPPYTMKPWQVKGISLLLADPCKLVLFATLHSMWAMHMSLALGPVEVGLFISSYSQPACLAGSTLACGPCM